MRQTVSIHSLGKTDCHIFNPCSLSLVRPKYTFFWRPCCHRYYFQIQNSKCVNHKNILQSQPNVNKITLKTFSLAFRADQKTLKERRSKMRHSVSPRESMEKEQQKTISVSTNSNRSKKSASPIVMPPPPPVWFIRNPAIRNNSISS